MAWAFHYFPFFLMSRQLFIHHYLPAHLASACVAGSVLNFILTESINYPVSVAGRTTRLRPKSKAKVGRKSLIVFGALSLAVVGTFVFLSPLTYGKPGWVPELFALAFREYLKLIVSLFFFLLLAGWKETRSTDGGCSTRGRFISVSFFRPPLPFVSAK